MLLAEYGTGEQLIGQQHVDCILLDRTMTGMGGRDCKFLKSSSLTADIPIIFLPEGAARRQ